MATQRTRQDAAPRHRRPEDAYAEMENRELHGDSHRYVQHDADETVASFVALAVICRVGGLFPEKVPRLTTTSRDSGEVPPLPIGVR